AAPQGTTPAIPGSVAVFSSKLLNAGQIPNLRVGGLQPPCPLEVRQDRFFEGRRVAIGSNTHVRLDHQRARLTDDQALPDSGAGVPLTQRIIFSNGQRLECQSRDGSGGTLQRQLTARSVLE